MAQMLVRINSTDAATAEMRFDATGGRRVMDQFTKLTRAIVAGLFPSNVDFDVATSAVSSTGTVTFASAINNDTVTIAGTVLTGVTGTPSGQAQFKLGVSNTADAAALAACINANTTLNKYVSATSLNAVVTITSLVQHVTANLITLASINGSRLAVSGATLSGAVSPTFTNFSYGG